MRRWVPATLGAVAAMLAYVAVSAQFGPSARSGFLGLGVAVGVLGALALGSARWRPPARRRRWAGILALNWFFACCLMGWLAL